MPLVQLFRCYLRFMRIMITLKCHYTTACPHKLHCTPNLTEPGACPEFRGNGVRVFLLQKLIRFYTIFCNLHLVILVRVFFFCLFVFSHLFPSFFSNWLFLFLFTEWAPLKLTVFCFFKKLTPTPKSVLGDQHN